MKLAKIDTKDIKKLSKKLKNIDKELDIIYIDYLNRVGDVVMAFVKENTSVVTGHLRNSWLMVPAKKDGRAYTLTIGNPVEYASYYEYGHRINGGKGWVEGRFVLKRGNEEAIEKSEKELKKAIKRRLEEHLYGK